MERRIIEYNFINIHKEETYDFKFYFSIFISLHYLERVLLLEERTTKPLTSFLLTLVAFFVYFLVLFNYSVSVLLGLKAPVWLSYYVLPNYYYYNYYYHYCLLGNGDMLSLVFSFLRDLTSLICPNLFNIGLKYISSFYRRSFSIYYFLDALWTKSNFPLNSLNSESAFSCSLFFNSINFFCLIAFNYSCSS